MSYSTECATLGVIGDEFDELLVAVGAPITSRRPWLEAWDASRPDRKTTVVIVRRDGRLTAAAPLAIGQRAFLRTATAVGHGTSDYTIWPALTELDATHLIAAVRSALGRRPWLMRLEQFDPSTSVVKMFAAEGAHVSPAESSFALVFERSRVLSDYLSKSTRQAVRTARNRAAKAGLPIEVTWHREWSDIEPLLPHILDVRRQRDEQLDRPAEPSWKVGFWRQAIKAHASTGEVEVATLHLDGELAAYLVAFLDGSSYRIWDTRFLPGLAFYSPGRLLAFETLDRAITIPHFAEVDWMRGDDPYKQLLTNSHIEYSRIELANPRWLQGVFLILERVSQGRPSHSSGSVAR